MRLKSQIDMICDKHHLKGQRRKIAQATTGRASRYAVEVKQAGRSCRWTEPIPRS